MSSKDDLIKELAKDIDRKVKSVKASIKSAVKEFELAWLKTEIIASRNPYLSEGKYQKTLMENLNLD